MSKKGAYKPPRLPLRIADMADIHIQSLSRINRGIKPPGVHLGAILARIARTSPDLDLDVDICDWIPYLFENPVVWGELVHAVKRRTGLCRRKKRKAT